MSIISKLKAHTSSVDRKRLEALINKELFNYNEVGCDCKSVIDNVWQLTGHIKDRRAITIDYYKMNRSNVKHRIKPVSIMFSEYYFYLIAYRYDKDLNTPYYFRIDRIVKITAHRENF